MRTKHVTTTYRILREPMPGCLKPRPRWYTALCGWSADMAKAAIFSTLMQAVRAAPAERSDVFIEFIDGQPANAYRWCRNIGAAYAVPLPA